MKRLDMLDCQSNEMSESEGRVEAKAETVRKGGDKSLCHGRVLGAVPSTGLHSFLLCEVLQEGG